MTRSQTVASVHQHEQAAYAVAIRATRLQPTAAGDYAATTIVHVTLAAEGR
jgi:hypothetical protein